MTVEDREERSQRAARRVRNARSHQAILDATNHLLAKVGYAALTIEGVAARAGVGKATVYRWWPSKGALAVEALSGDDSDYPVRDTGDLWRDLIAAVDRIVAVLSSSTEGTIISAMTGDLVRDPAMAQQFRDRILRPRRSAVASMLSRAAERGDLPADVDVPLVLDVCVGTVFYRLVVSGEPLTGEFSERLVDLVLNGARPSGD